MIEADIRRLLSVAADDQDAPAATPAWLRVERVRSYRRRQRQVGSTAVLGLACTVAGIAITMGSTEPSSAHSAASSGTPSSRSTSAPAPATASATASTEQRGGPLVVVKTETKTVGGQVLVEVVRQTAHVTATVPGALRTMQLHDTVTASTTVTATQTDVVTDTTTRTETATQTVTTTVNHTVHSTVTVVPPPQTTTVTVTQSPSQSGQHSP